MESSKDESQDNVEGPFQNAPFIDWSYESGHRATSPHGNRSAAKAPRRLPRKMMKPREYLYLNILIGDFVAELIIGSQKTKRGEEKIETY